MLRGETLVVNTTTPHKVVFSPEFQRPGFTVPLQILLGETTETFDRDGDFNPSETPNGIRVFESGTEVWFQLVRPETEGVALETTVYQAYSDLLQEVAARGLTLVRAWNYIPEILVQQDGLERYRKFNIGRKNAWDQFGPRNDSGEMVFPAATGIDSLGGGLRIEIMATRHPVVYVENPRQRPSSDYSGKFGPKPPVFARGAIHFHPRRTEMFISGTASILGGETVHVGDPAEQTREALRNIEILIGKENTQRYGYAPGFTLQDLVCLRVYIKDPEHFEIIRQVVLSTVPIPEDKIIFLRADICRSDLLVEIEGFCTKELR